MMKTRRLAMRGAPRFFLEADEIPSRNRSGHNTDDCGSRK